MPPLIPNAVQRHIVTAIKRVGKIKSRKEERGKQSLVSIILIFLEVIINVSVIVENLKAMTCNFSHRSLPSDALRRVVLLS
jgi:hypothetical protein